MSQRLSGYVRRANDEYDTPAWVTAELVPHLPRQVCLREPAPGNGQMVDALLDHGFSVSYECGRDFLSDTESYSAVVTNPPYSLATEFVEKALALTKPTAGFVAMLLRTDFDHAKTRRHLFGDCSQFAKKVVLLKRVVWFERRGAAPSYNHAWFLWDWQHRGPPSLAYSVGPERQQCRSTTEEQSSNKVIVSDFL
jgi:hypothetical protein